LPRALPGRCGNPECMEDSSTTRPTSPAADTAIGWPAKTSDTTKGTGAASSEQSEIDPVARETGTMEELDEQECWRLLRSVEVGRLAMTAAGDVDIFPVNFVVDGTTVVFRSAAGTKLFEVVLGGRIAFETDGYEAGHGRAWSVVLKGHGEVIDRWGEIYAAQELPIVPWNHSPKERFVRVVATSITGRRFTVYSTRDGSPPAL